MAQRDIVVVGASAGGVEALKIFIKSLPTDLHVSVLVVLHIPEHSKSRLAEILQLETSMPVVSAEDEEIILPDKIYVARAGRHMIVEDEKLIFGYGPKENRFRPSVDALFRSAAYTYKSRVIGILLSGAMDDGNSGLWTIKRLGGLAVVQEEREAIFPQMVMNAKHHIDIDHEVPAAKLGPLLRQIVNDAPPSDIEELSEEAAKMLELEIIVAKRDNAYELRLLEYGKFTPITCPECHGALVQLVEGRIIRYRCHTGHAFTVSSLLAGISLSIHNQLWQAMKGMEENSILLEKLSDHFKTSNYQDISKSYQAKADEFKKKAQAIHTMILDHKQVSGDPKTFEDKSSKE